MTMISSASMHGVEPVATRPLAFVQGASLYCYGVDFNKNVTEVFDRE